MKRQYRNRTYERLKNKMASIPAIAPSKNDPIRLTDPEQVELSAVLWSDLHFSAYYKNERAARCRAAMADLSGAKCTLDALVIAGDLAENGKQVEKDYLAEQLLCLQKVRRVLPAAGNHDLRFRHILHSIRKFAAFCRKVNPELDVDKMYYSCDLNGYTFIVLGTTRTEFEECFFDEEELFWLKSELRRATAGGKPVFVVVHQPLRLTHNLPYSWDFPGDDRGSVGPQSDRLRRILNEYENVFLLSGHLHRGFSINTYEEVGRVHSVSIPSLGIHNKDCIYATPGMGFIMEGSRNKVLFRPRDFMTGKFLPEFDKEYPLVPGGLAERAE